MIITITLHLFFTLFSNGDNIGSTYYVVYQKENVLTIEAM